MSEPSQQPTTPPRATRRRRLARVGRWGLTTIAVLVLIASGLIVLALGRPITAPDWVQARIEARLAEALPQVRVGFGEMVFVVERGWHPRVRLRQVTVQTPEGVQLAAFSEAKAALSMEALLARQLAPRSVSLTGVFATLRRDEDGRVSLSGGEFAGPARQAATLPGLIKELDRIMELPALSALRSVEMRALTLNFEDRRAGRRWTVDGGRLTLARQGRDLDLQADLAVLGGGAGAAVLSANYASTIGAQEATFGVTFDGVAAGDIATQGPAFAWMDVLRAPISGAVRSGVGRDGTLEPLNATLQIGKGVVQPNDGTRPIPFDGARSYFSYDAAAGALRFDELSVQSAWVTGRAEGTAHLGVTDGKLEELVAQFVLSGVRTNPRGLYPDPVVLERAELDVQVKLNPFQLRLGRLMIADQGQVLRADGRLAAQPEGWQLALDAQMDAISPDRLLALWPATLKTKTRRWIAENLLAGTLGNIQMGFRLAPDGAPPRSLLSFEYEDADVRFMKTMPPITGASGHASLQGSRFVVALDRGRVTAGEGGEVALRNAAFIIPDVTVKGGTPALVRLNTSSSVTAALSLLNRAPLSVMDKAGLPVALAQGRADLSGTLAFPLAKGTKPDQVTYDVTGDLTALSSDSLIKGRDLRAQAMTLKADNAGVTISGAGQLDGVGFDAAWAQPIGKGSRRSTVRGRVEITPEALATFNIALPDGMVRGRGNGTLEIDLERDAPPRLALQSDLRGLALSVPQVGWSKPTEAAGKLTVEARLGGTPQVDLLRVEAPGLTAAGKVVLRDGGALDRVRFDRLQVGGWLDVPVDLVGQGASRAPQVVVRGGTLDMRRAEFASGGGQGSGAGRAPPMKLRLDKLQITDTIALTTLEGTFATGRGLEGTFQGRLNNLAPIVGRVSPQGGRSAIRVEAQDAGAVVRAAGVLKQASGGSLILTLLPVGSGGAFDGRLQIADTRITDAPSVAALLNALSIVGLLEQMNGEGIYFDTVEADFRLTPNRMTLTRASAVGASIGISMDGVYNTDSGEIAFQGVVSPAYFLNGIGALFTRKGEGLIGFNYTLTGLASAPKVAVNPLSALTPGMFRDIFRAPPPDLPAVEGVAQSTLPPPEAGAPENPVVKEYEGR